MQDPGCQKTPQETVPREVESFRHPFTLPLARKLHIVTAGTLFIFNSAFGSSLPSGAHDALAEYFHLPSDSLKLVLPNSLYMVGFALGPLIFGPLSEHVGRKPVLVGTYFGYLVFSMACALAPNFPALLVFRLLCGLNAASPNAVLGGLYADIFESPQTRGTALAIFMVVTAFGPQLAPLVSGFISEVSWRWTFWVGLAAGGVEFPVMVLIPETYVPVLKERAWKREAKHSKICAASTPLKHSGGSAGFMVVFTRPFVMTAKEPVLLFSSLFMGFTYAIFYLYFQAYPIVFQNLYGLSPGVAGLAFLPISVGAVFAFTLFMVYTSYHTKAVAANKAWATVEEYRRLPLAAVGAPLLPIALFWLGWSAKISIHPIMPIMSGLWFGMGYILIFMAMINYLTDAYKQYSASAQAAASTMRSTFAVCLPLATNSILVLAKLEATKAKIPRATFARLDNSPRPQSPLLQRSMAAPRHVSSPSATPDRVFLEACHIYFRHCHNKPYGFFSAKLFHQKVSHNEVPLYLRLALIASATRYSSRSQWQERKQSTIDSYAKLSWELIMTSVNGLDDNADVTVIQTLALLALIDATAGRRRGAWVKIGMAVRISQDLQMMLEPDASLSDLERDERRNLFWSLYLLDRFVCCAFTRPPALKDSECLLNLPAYSEPESGFTVTSLHGMLNRMGRDMSLRPGMFGVSIGLSSVLGRTVKCMMNEGPRTEAPWHPHSEYKAVYADLEFLKEIAVKNGPVLAATGQPQFSRPMRDPDREQIAHMVLSHTLYHLSHCILGHPYLLGLKVSTFSHSDIPASWLQETRATCLVHAGALITILVEAKAAGYMPVPSFYSYCILVASTVQALYLHSDDPSTRTSSEGYLKTSLQYLANMSELWENAHIMANALESFTSQCARYSDILLQNEPRVKNLTPTESAILRSVVDYWEMMNPRNPVFDRTSVRQSDFPALPATSPGYLTPLSPNSLDGITLGVGNSSSAGNEIDPDILVPCSPSAMSPMVSDECSPRWDWDNELENMKN